MISLTTLLVENLRPGMLTGAHLIISVKHIPSLVYHDRIYSVGITQLWFCDSSITYDIYGYNNQYPYDIVSLD
jgi:hypothetical protein